MPLQREPQLAYSELMSAMLDEEARRRKACKILAVVRHHLGRDDLAGLTAVDIGCSAGFIADELASAGARMIGLDIDVPGLQRAQQRFGGSVGFVCADGSRMPLANDSVDLVVLNHIYEHVVDPDAVLDEVHRVLSDEGLVYLGLANRFGVVEPHYRLPFLSYLPPPLADRYVRATGRAPHYHERLRSPWALRRLMQGFTVWDYSVMVIKQPDRFAATETVGGAISRVPERILHAALPAVPTYIWVAAKHGRPPARAGATRVAVDARTHRPRRLVTERAVAR